MHSPPEPFSERDVLELADRIESHAAACEKFAFFEGFAEDPELRDLLARCRALFARHSEELEGLLTEARRRCDYSTYTHYEPYALPHPPRPSGRCDNRMDSEPGSLSSPGGLDVGAELNPGLNAR